MFKRRKKKKEDTTLKLDSQSFDVGGIKITVSNTSLEQRNDIATITLDGENQEHYWYLHNQLWRQLQDEYRCELQNSTEDQTITIKEPEYRFNAPPTGKPIDYQETLKVIQKYAAAYPDAETLQAAIQLKNAKNTQAQDRLVMRQLSIDADGIRNAITPAIKEFISSLTHEDLGNWNQEIRPDEVHKIPQDLAIKIANLSNQLKSDIMDHLSTKQSKEL